MKDYIITDDGTWEIYTAQGLLAWNAYVTNTKNYVPFTDDSEYSYYVVKTNATLMADIMLPDPEEGQTSNWTPVGSIGFAEGKLEEYYYAGTFDGGGHTISNLKIDSSDSNYLGLFAYIAPGGVVKNLALSDVEISGAKYIGGIAGMNYGTIENCSVYGSASGSSFVGGIAGYNENGGKITACYNKGNVSGAETWNSVGGIAGSNKGEISGCTNSANVIATAQQGRACAGGITGYNYGNISTSCNEGSIKADGIKFACSGGIAGYNYSGNITDTCNNGSVYAECKDGDTTSGVEIFPGSYAGGIVGFNEYGTIKDNNNSAEEVSATSTDLPAHKGDIAGYW